MRKKTRLPPNGPKSRNGKKGDIIEGLYDVLGSAAGGMGKGCTSCTIVFGR